MIPSRPAPRWFGSKWRLAPWIIAHLPPHTTYVEPFAGGMGVFLNKPASTIEVLNDLDGDIVNFFRCLRDHGDQLIDLIRWTPYSHEEQRHADATFRRPARIDLPPLERARQFYVLCNQSWGGKKHSGRRSWRRQTTDNRGKVLMADWNEIDHLYVIAHRIKDAFIEQHDALAVLDTYDAPDCCFYLDPPYLPAVRMRPDHGYEHEMTDADHLRLLERLLRLQGSAIISGYPHYLYDSVLLPAGWTTHTTTARTTNQARTATEVIWISPNAICQPSLFPQEDYRGSL